MSEDDVQWPNYLTLGGLHRARDLGILKESSRWFVCMDGVRLCDEPTRDSVIGHAVAIRDWLNSEVSP